MEICHFITSLGRGGAETMVSNIIENINDGEISLKVCYLVENHDLVNEVHDAGAETICFGGMNREDPKAHIKALQYFKSNSFDLIHAHLPHAQVTARLAKKLGFVNYVICTHHNLPDLYGTIPRKLERSSRKYDDKDVAVSKCVMNAYLTKGANPEKWTTIYNGIDVDEWYTQIKEAELPIINSKSTNVFVNIGRLIPEKGQLSLIEAFNLYNKDHGDSKLIIIGEGPQQAQLSSKIKTLKLEDNVVLKGSLPRKDIPKYLVAADAFVSTSRSEGFGLTIIEAMVAKLPIIATDIPAVREVIQGYDCSILINRNKPILMKQAMEEITSSNDLYSSCDRGYVISKNKFDLEVCASEYIDLYKSTIN
ncbi:glycosyltransferase [Haladaptatus sp. W1]|uniref:glycosyltransferase n=1 Tax=Haladaptatus sp. W1 TaxID=1897478 RepID=UPI0009F40A2F|nr:glycosyltransferase [Haladaptatus sp. W1]